jgi:hypothetical protein
MIKKKVTRSKFFLLPLTFLPLNYFENSLGVYCRFELDKINNQYCNRIYVVFNKEELTEENNKNLLLSSSFIKTMDLDECCIVFVYRILPMFIQDYYMFIQGKYSKFTNKYKELLTNVYNLKIKDKTDTVIFTKDVYKIFYPSNKDIYEKSKALNVNSKLIKELSSKPNLIEETLYVSSLYNLHY